MDFRIKSVVLWPNKEELGPRSIDFDIDKVNVITGASGKGKSSIISIIDYCLGSSRCMIPAGIIRKSVKAFGIVVATDGKEILIVRQEPGAAGVSNNFVKIEDVEINIPIVIDDFPLTVLQIKQYLNSFLGFADVGLVSNDYVQSYDAQKPSYRNAISLNFQPQFIIANQSTMFFKADSPAHKEKLKILFPYLLGVISNKILELREELKGLKRQLNVLVKHKDLKEYRLSRLNSELVNYYRLGREFGLIEVDLTDESAIDKEFIIQELKAIVSKEIEHIRVPEQATQQAADKLYELGKRELNSSDQLQDLGRRLAIIKNIQTNNKEIGDNTLTKRGRLSAVNWLEEKIDFDKPCPMCHSVTSHIHEYQQNLSGLLKGFEKVSDRVADSAKIYLNERRKIERQISEKEAEINSIRNQISALQREDGEFKRLKQNQNAIYRYLGQVELTLNQFEEFSDNVDNEEELIENLKTEIERIENEVGSAKLKNKERFALNKISENIKKYAVLFEAEKSDDTIDLDISDNMTLRFYDKLGSETYFWEVGSGHNHMAYHLSTYLGIHEFLSGLNDNKVPTFIIFDQPSQAYFPEIKDDMSVQEEDLMRLKKIFEVLAKFNENVKGKVQVIVLEHAGEDSWKEFKNVVKTERWRPDEIVDALIPSSWLKDNIQL